jgi:hypothetical protein
MNEQETRELLQLMRGVAGYVERCLKTEKEKNEERLKKQLEAVGVEITKEDLLKDGVCPLCGHYESSTEEWDF